MFPLIVGCVGEEAALQLRIWCETYYRTPSIECIFEGKENRIPSRPEMLLALSSRIVSELDKHNTNTELSNAIEYIMKMPPEFKNRIFTDFFKRKTLHKFLERNRYFDEWVARSGYDWDD